MSRRSRSKPADPESHFDAEEEVDEDQEVTRCICGQDELNASIIDPSLASVLLDVYSIKVDQGLFIQCDKCSVWQHGYCVGLFTNDDVPDKYWCELCKPDLHVFVYENAISLRTLYRPVNDTRKKLQLDNVEHHTGDGLSTRLLRGLKRVTPEGNKPTRKERRHYDEYDEQLKLAIRESAKESGISVDDKRLDLGISKRPKRRKQDSDSDRRPKTENEESDLNDLDESNIDEESEFAKAAEPKKTKPKSAPKPKSTKSKKRLPHPEANGHTLSKDELTNQSSKPRYVNEKSSIYELRKRTGAILEWLGRLQLELDEERQSKIELFSYQERPNNLAEEQRMLEQNALIVENFNRNLKLMEGLTETILNWEQQFGKYAP